jgi:hypothetical protein
MKTTHYPLFGLLLVVLVAIAAVISGSWIGAGDAIVEASDPVVGVPSPGADETQMVANCRYGAAAEKFSGYQAWMDDLGAGWWLDFQVNYTDPAPNGAEYAHLIWVQQNKDSSGNYLDSYFTLPTMKDDSLGLLIQRRVGRLWIIGNEVERGPDPGQIYGGQGDTMPEMYARIYHDLYYYIKDWDPTALVTPSALVQFTPGRAQYLDMVWDAYKQRYGESMPVDLWNMHLYILPEMRNDGTPSYSSGIANGTDPALGMLEFNGDLNRCERSDVYCLYEHDSMENFADQVIRMRTWMKDHGYRNKPLIITEYSILYAYEQRPEPEGCWVKDEFGNCFTPQRVGNFAAATFEYLKSASDPELGYPYDNYRLVQQWLWYSVYRTGLGRASNLATSGSDPLNLTPAGLAFSQATRAEPARVNLIAADPIQKSGSVGSHGTVSARIGVTVVNNGNTRLNQPITVTFYRDEALTDVIYSKTIQAPGEDSMGLTGCATRSMRIEVDASWPGGMDASNYRYWAKVDSSDAVAESDEADNIAIGFVLTLPDAGYVPVVLR